MLKSFGKSILIYGVASGISQSIMLILVPLYSRIFSPVEYGTIDLVFTIISFASIIGMLQLESAVARYFYEDDSKEYQKRLISTAFWIIVFFSFLLMILLIVLSDHFSLLVFGNLDNSNAIMWAGIAVPLFNIFAYLSLVFRFMKKPLLFTRVVVVQLIVTVALAFWLVYYKGLGISGVFMAQAGGLLLASLVAIINMREMIMFVIDRKLLKRLFKYSLPLLPAVSGTWANEYFNRFVMLGYLSLADIGIFTVAIKIASVFKLLENAFRMAWGPFMWEQLKKEGHRELYREVMKISCIVVFALVAIFSLFSSNVLEILTTDEYAVAAPLIGMLALSFGTSIVVQTIGLGPAIKEKTIYNTGIFFISVAINIISLFILVPNYGVIGVPIALLLSYIGLVICAWVISERLYPIGFSKTIFISTFMGAFGVVGYTLIEPPNIILQTSITTGICLLLYLFYRNVNWNNIGADG